MRAAPILLLAAGCSWTQFDSLADDAWAQSTQAPSIGATTYGVGLASGFTSSGGQLLVVSDSAPNLSSLEYTAKGSAKLGINQQLNEVQITTIRQPPIVATDATGDCAVVGADNGNAVAYLGCQSSPTSAVFPGGSTATSAAYIGKRLVIANANILLSVDATGAKCWCYTTTAPIAFGGDATHLYAWQTDGGLATYAEADFAMCAPVMGTAPDPGVLCDPTGAPTLATNVIPPGDGNANVLLAGNYAVLASGTQVLVADVAATTPALVGSPLAIGGASSVALGKLGDSGNTYLALGFPERGKGGEVDVYALDTTTGRLAGSPEATLADAQPESGQKFGRAVAVMSFNATNILVVAAKSEVFAYFRTLLYSETRQK